MTALEKKVVRIGCHCGKCVDFIHEFSCEKKQCVLELELRENNY